MIHLSHAYNITQPPIQRQQWGGTAFCLNKVAHKVIVKGLDESKLGRWCWTKYRGRNNHTLVIFVAYCPNAPTGPFSVYAQYWSFFTLTQDNRCPRGSFADDFIKAIQKITNEGAHVKAMLDGSSNMKCSLLAAKLSAIQMREAMLHRHGYKGPFTFRINSSRTPIDSIWIS
jgi:hypothetical protein